MNRYFTSDLHIGHRLVAELRGFTSVNEHDEWILNKLTEIGSRVKLWFLGDIVIDRSKLDLIKAIPAKNKVLIMGNHDVFSAREYLEVFDEIIGPVKYKNYFLTHQPIHPQEIYRVKGNIHGHIHGKMGATKDIEGPYFNVNIENMERAVSFDEIEERFKYDDPED